MVNFRQHYVSPPKSSTFDGFEDRTAAGISGLRRLQSRRVRGAQAKRLSSPARCCGWEIGNQCEQVYELSDFAIKYLVIRLLIMICIVGCGMKPAGAIPHRAKSDPAGQGRAVDRVAWESAWGKRERWEGAKARTAFPQSRPELAPAAAVGGFCGGAPCPDGIQFLVPDLLGPGQSTSLLSAGGGGMSFFAASAQPISSDLPYQRPIPRKVLRFCRGPSMLEADFMEGRRFFRGTFHARGCFHGRSCVFHGDLPC